MSGRGGKGGKGEVGKGSGKGYEGGKAGRGGKGSEAGKGGLQPCSIETTPPPKFDKAALPNGFIGAFSWTGRDSERLRPGEEPAVAEAEPAAGQGKKKEGAAVKFEKAAVKPAGTLGQPIQVVSNMVALDLTSQERHLYRVDFVPEQEQRRFREYLLHAALESIGVKSEQWAYDKDCLVYSHDLLDGKKNLDITTKRNVTREQEETVVVKLRWTSHQQAKLTKATVQFFCTRFRAGMAKQEARQAIGQDYFDFSQAIDVSRHRCQLVPGLDCTIYVTQCGPVLNADLMYKHVRTDTVWDNMHQIKHPDWQKVAEMDFARRVVLSKYTTPFKSVIIDKVRFDLSPQSTFLWKKQNKKITYADYFRERYGVKDKHLDDKTQPLLEHTSRTERDKDGQPKVSYYIPSLVYLTGQTAEMKADRNRSQDLIRITAAPPNQRLEKVHSNLKAILENPKFQEQLQPWGMTVGTKLLQLPARRLPTPKLVNGKFPVIVKGDQEAWDVRFDWPMLRPTQMLNNWAIVTFKKTPELEQFVRNLQQVAKEVHVPMGTPQVYEATDASTSAYEKVLMEQVKAQAPQMVLVGVAKVDEPYKRVKRVMTGLGVLTQFVQQTLLNEKNSLTIANKVLVQMNCKGGGAPWKVDLPISEPTMFIGLDVHHGGDLEKKAASVAAFVASIDSAVTSFYSRSFLVKSRQQILKPLAQGDAGLKELTVTALEGFKQARHTLPKYVVVYRDGGSEGELDQIRKAEVTELLQALQEAATTLKSPTVPKLLFIVVLKKIRTRFFATDGAGAVGNPLPGTVVDTHVVSHAVQEFYLVCQHVNQGSATPTKYQKIYDDTDLTTDQIQTTTYNLAHIYFNWYGTVRVPSVLMYASKLAKFIGLATGGDDVKATLHKRLHYL